MKKLDMSKHYMVVDGNIIIGIGHTEGQLEHDIREQLENSNLKLEDFEVFECSSELFHEALMSRITTSWSFDENGIAVPAYK